MNPFKVISPQGQRVPILLSIPHCGVSFPDELVHQYKNDLSKQPDDTDWFVDQLYDFGSAMGISTISAVYSRWVIDLNRDPESKPLYTDGRIITSLCPTTDFFGNPIYIDERKEVPSEETQRRLDRYYHPYHQKVEELLSLLKNEFGQVLLWDCHSIRQFVPTIHKDRFPDLILGDADGTSASPGLIETALLGLEHSEYKVSHNYPFKGGYITRNFGKPTENQHALQLEMSKLMYMDDNELNYSSARASKMQGVLKNTFEKLIDAIG
ncbi:MAG TPA: N-formylglutamate deformylase [Cytophagales bacterium]|nr:N-formylglutamate deformylase [Cytophagales bacterium]